MNLSDMKWKKTEPDDYIRRIKSRYLNQGVEEKEFQSLLESKIELYLYQLETALYVTSDQNPRIILADEVGLGKTIEAGLILTELQNSGKANKTLIVVPASLFNQWKYELYSKFGIFVKSINHKNIDSIASESQDGVFLATLDFAKNYRSSFNETFWDLIIFDEAHHLRRMRTSSGVKETQRYQFGWELRNKTRGLLLLTATPMQLDDFEFFSLLQLLDEETFPDYDSFETYRSSILPKIESVIKDLAAGKDVFYDARVLFGYLKSCFPKVDHLPIDLESKDKHQWAAVLKEYLFFPKFMIRHRKREEFPRMPPREISTHPIDYSSKEMQVYNGISEFIKTNYRIATDEKLKGVGLVMILFQQMLTSSPYAVLQSFKRRRSILQSVLDRYDSIAELFGDENIDEEYSFAALNYAPIEEELAQLERFIDELEGLSTDSKLEALINLISKLLIDNPNEKVIIFTRFVDTQYYLFKRLGQQFKVTIFNGKMSANEKDSSAKYFRKEAQIMISTEAGGEGRNFQFCHYMVNYDLPWNPMKLEQRIGRIDRIGQAKPVIVVNMATFDTIEEKVFNTLVTRLSEFSNLIGDIDPVLGSLESDIEKLIMVHEKLLDAHVDDFLETLEDKIAKSKKSNEILKKLSISQDISHYRNLAKTIMDESRFNERLLSVILDSSNTLGFKISKIDKDVFKIDIGDDFERKFGTKRSFIGTVNRKEAIENDIDFFTPNHELVKEIVSVFSSTKYVFTSSECERREEPSLTWTFGFMVPDTISDWYYVTVNSSKKSKKILKSDEILGWHPLMSDHCDVGNANLNILLKKDYSDSLELALRSLNFEPEDVFIAGLRIINGNSLLEEAS